jgi:thiosulfate/3-mercaptopyruvate sulfurtransferase
VRLLNGPRERWIAEGRPTTAEPPSHAPTTFIAKPGNAAIRATRDQVLHALDRTDVLVDVRAPQEYSGELIAMPGYESEGAQRSGHIPGAKSIPWAQAVNEDGTFKPVDELRELYRDKGALSGAPIIS